MEKLLWRVHHRPNEVSENTWIGDVGVFFALAALVIVEFFVNGVVRGFTPRPDIVFLLFLHSRGRVPGCLALFSVGIVRDFLFFAPVGSSAVFYVLSNSIMLRMHSGLESKLGLMFTVVLIYLLQLVNGFVFGATQPIAYLLQQVPLCYVLCLLLARSKGHRSKVVTFEV